MLLQLLLLLLLLVALAAVLKGSQPARLALLVLSSRMRAKLAAFVVLAGPAHRQRVLRPSTSASAHAATTQRHPLAVIMPAAPTSLQHQDSAARAMPATQVLAQLFGAVAATYQRSLASRALAGRLSQMILPPGSLSLMLSGRVRPSGSSSALAATLDLTSFLPTLLSCASTFPAVYLESVRILSSSM
jgi:hypothetical protein